MIQKKISKMLKMPIYYSIPLLVVCISAFFILISLFNLDIPSLMLQPVPLDVRYVNSCGTLSQSDTYYLLNKSLVANNSVGNYCLTIEGNNIILDGRLKYLINNSAPLGKGVNIKGNNNVVKNLNITGKGYGIYLNSSNNNQIYDNLIFGNQFGIYVNSLSDNNLISRNVILNTSLSGIRTDSLNNNNTFSENIVFGAFNGIYLFSNANIVLRNTILSDNLGIYLSSQENSRNIVSGNNINVTSSQGYNVWVDNSTVEFIDNSISSYKLVNSSVDFVSRGESKISFSNLLNGIGDDLSSDVKNGFNYVSVDSSKLFLNVSAVVTLYGLPTNLSNYTILRDGVPCPVNICRNITSLNAGTVVFNVTGWTNYSISLGSNYSVPVISSPRVVINSPDDGRLYTQSSFPILFDVSLNRNGSILFGLNNDSVNKTMNTTNNINFSYVQSLLPLGNYTLKVSANFTSGEVLNSSVGFRVVDVVPIININEPDNNEQYTLSAFPVTFDVSLNVNGTVKFSFDVGRTNITMNTTNNRDFEYVQNSLSIGNYNLTAYGILSNNTIISDFVKFKVVSSSSSSSGGSSSGGGSSSSSSGGSSSGGGFNNSNLYNSNLNDSTENTNILSSKQSTSLGKNIIYWILVVVIFVMIIILILLIVRALLAKINQNLKFNSSNSLISNLK